MFLCPSRGDTPLRKYILTKLDVDVGYLNYINYGYNYSYIGSSFRDGSSAFPWFPPVRDAGIRHPAETILLGESQYVYDPNYEEGWQLLHDRYPANQYEGILRAPHTSTTNVLWIDGHADSHKVESTVGGMYPNCYSGIFANHTKGDPDNHWDRE